MVVEGMQASAVLECMACREAFALAEDLTISNFVVASDAKQIGKDFSKIAMDCTAWLSKRSEQERLCSTVTSFSKSIVPMVMLIV